MKVLLNYETRPRPTIECPAYNDPGDLCHHDDETKTRISSILARYGGNIAEMLKWRKEPVYGDTTVMQGDLQDMLVRMRDARAQFENLHLDIPWDEALRRANSGDFSFLLPSTDSGDDSTNTVNNKQEVNHETQKAENQPKGE